MNPRMDGRWCLRADVRFERRRLVVAAVAVVVVAVAVVGVERDPPAAALAPVVALARAAALVLAAAALLAPVVVVALRRSVLEAGPLQVVALVALHPVLGRTSAAVPHNCRREANDPGEADQRLDNYLPPDPISEGDQESVGRVASADRVDRAASVGRVASADRAASAGRVASADRAASLARVASADRVDRAASAARVASAASVDRGASVLGLVPGSVPELAPGWAADDCQASATAAGLANFPPALPNNAATRFRIAFPEKRATGTRFDKAGKTSATRCAKTGKTTATLPAMIGRTGSTITTGDMGTGTGATPADTGIAGIICGTIIGRRCARLAWWGRTPSAPHSVAVTTPTLLRGRLGGELRRTDHHRAD